MKTCTTLHAATCNRQMSRMLKLTQQIRICVPKLARYSHCNPERKKLILQGKKDGSLIPEMLANTYCCQQIFQFTSCKKVEHLIFHLIT